MFELSKTHWSMGWRVGRPGYQSALVVGAGLGRHRVEGARQGPPTGLGTDLVGNAPGLWPVAPSRDRTGALRLAQVFSGPTGAVD